MRRDLSNKVLSFTAANISAQVATTLTGIFLARTLSLQDLGTYRQVILLVNMVSGIFSLGLPLSLLYFLPRMKEDEEKARFAGQTLVALAIMGGVASLGAVFFSGIVAIRFHNEQLGPLLPVASPLFLAALLLRYIAPLFLSLDRARLAGLFRIAQAVGVSLVLVFLVLIGQPLALALLGMAIAEGASIAVALLLQHRILPLRLSFDRALLKAQMAYAVPLAISGMVGLLSRQVDQIMISMYMDPKRFALYSIGATEIPVVMLLVRSAGSVVLPQLSARWGEHDQGEFTSLFSATQRKVSLLCIPITVAFIALAQPFLVFLYGEPFAASANVFRIYGLIQLNRLFLFGILLQALGLTRMMLLGELAFMVVNVIGNWFFLRWIGFLGPAIATELAGLMVVVFYLWQIGRRTGLHRVAFYRLGHLLRFLLASAAGGVVAWRVSLLFSTPLIALIAGGIVYLVVVLLLLLVTRSLHPDELRLLQPWRWRFPLR